MTGNKYLRKLTREIAPHVDAERGVTNELIRDLCHILCPNYFRGVFSSHELDAVADRRRFVGSGYFSVIVNISAQPPPADGHFVLIHARPSRLLYLDPFGAPCQDAKVMSFVKKCRGDRPFYENKRAIQSPLSTFCGMYAVLFALYYDFSHPPVARIEWIRSSDPFVLLKNDRICIKYLKLFINFMNMDRVHVRTKLRRIRRCFDDDDDDDGDGGDKKE